MLPGVFEIVNRRGCGDTFAHRILGLQLLIFAACVSGTAEPDEPDAPSDLPSDEWIYSSWVGDHFRVYFHTPDSFTSDDAPDTHLVILLDADWYMDGSHERLGNGGVIGIAEWLARAGTIPEVAILGVGEINRYGNNMRARDFLTAPSDFVNFIAYELLPWFYEIHAPAGQTFRDVSLMGHSDGGYFAIWALFRDGPPLFRNVIAISGDFTKPHYDVFAMEEAYHGRSPDMPSCLFLGVGGLEEERFLTSFSSMVEAIESRGSSSLTLNSHLYDNRNHGSVVAPAFSDGLTFSFSNDCYP